ncbi:MAG: glycosyltransferase family 2 protein [Candidatus Acidiferrales bacterium]
MNRLTATIITLNEEKNLPRALTSVAGLADEIVVVDSGSTDRTVEIARQVGARVLQRVWTDYSDQKNFAAAQASRDWILSLDADEELNPELQAALRRWKSELAMVTAYSMNRKANYCGRWILHSGWCPDPKFRLYHRQRARWVGALHESLEVNGAVEPLPGEILHYTMNSFDEHARRVRHYTTLAARLLFVAGQRRWFLPLLAASPWAFLRTFFFQQGFRDGVHGLQIATMAAYYVFLKYRKLGILVRGGSLEPEGSRS